MLSSFLKAGLLVATAVAAGCTAVVVEDPRPLPPRPGPEPVQFCTREYAPVCGTRGGTLRTFGNDCEADAAGFRIAYDGECRVSRPIAPPPPVYVDRPRPPRPDRGPAFCTREYAPVCGRRGDRIRTFGNDCEAESAGFRIIDDGPC